MSISSAYLASIIESSDDAIISKTLDGTVTSWNLAAEQIFGYTAAEMIGSPISLILPPDRQGEMQSILEKIKRGERIQHFETVRRKKNGQLVPVSLSISPILGDDGQVVGAAKIARDITERLARASKLREIEERYGDALWASGIGTWRIDPFSGMAARDERACRLLELPAELRECPLGVHFGHLSPDDRDRALRALENAARTGEPYQQDYKVVTPNGVRWVRDRGRLHEGRESGGAVLTGCLTDISEQAGVAQQLVTEHARLRSIVDQLPVGVMVIDLPSRRFALCNPAAERIMGRPIPDDLESELALRSGSLPDGTPYTPNDWPVMRTLLTGATVMNEEIAIRTADGRVKVIDASSGPVLGPGGQTIGVLATYVDITDRKRTAEHYRLMFERSPVPLWVYDEVTLEFLAVNQAAIHDYGFSRAEFLAMTIRDIRPPEDVPILIDRISKLEKGYEKLNWADQPERYWRHQRKDGSLMHVDIRSHSIQFEGHPARLVMSIDVTSKQRLEEQLRQSQKMEAIGQLAGGIAHDFNNLLTVIGGYANLSLMGLADDHPIRPHLAQIASAGDRAAALTHQLLAFGRKQVLQLRVLNINTVVQGMRPLLARLLREDIQLEMKLDPAVCQVEADPHQLEQVLMNLVINASDAMAAGGLVTIESQEVILDEAYVESHLGVKPGRHAMLAVSDTGYGMDAKTQARIFEPFFTTKPAGKGTGLGLSTAFGIVKQSGGHIAVYSEPDVGSTFKVYLPAATALARTADDKPAVTSVGGSETILLVEDDPGVREFAARVLRELGYTVHEAANGEQALRTGRILGDLVDLLVTDVVMPNLGGRQLSEALAPICRKMRVLFMSGYTQNAIVQHGVLDPGLEFLAKPFNSRSLSERIREVLATPIRPRSVLLLDGDAAVTALLRDALEMKGYTVAIAADGADAVARCRQKPVDLLVVDAIAPESEALDQIHLLSHELPHVRLVAIAGNWDDHVRREARRAGAHECLQKPVSLDVFLKTVRDLIG
ncbi:hybrid sensor histidine kinase/response regulator [Paludibaculum fermentans]|uniref:histidine kinase n=1 Tax=Paludibaculum fermentans TaxID=1473598 RepID=A0A7S7NV46_PALFE|nr:PAS domain S-box protein [Paludibaculum fermentans]QOY90298.1 PAS domain S-box protein [Paludibaculum fermentans]